MFDSSLLFLRSNNVIRSVVDKIDNSKPQIYYDKKKFAKRVAEL